MPVLTTQEMRLHFPQRGRILAVDVGTKRLGLALSDTAQTLATPRPYLPRTQWTQDFNLFKQLIEKEQVTAIVIGNPLTMKGDNSASTDAAHSYADLLAKGFPALQVALWDERLSSAAAERALFERRVEGSRQTRASKKSATAFVDSTAATLFLQAALDYLRGRK
ncbi:MAG: Holliday junction resolvase RuvX [Alphaproteobacteria bacterium]